MRAVDGHIVTVYITVTFYSLEKKKCKIKLTKERKKEEKVNSRNINGDRMKDTKAEKQERA
jgi:hypothetical protein